MKKFKSLIYVLALALIFVGAVGVTKASAEETEQEAPAVVKVVEGNVDVFYDAEIIDVECEKQVYYQIVKQKSANSGLKTANWIKAAKTTYADGEGEPKDHYLIDFSGTSNSKDAFFALTTDSTQGNADFVAEVNAVIKSVKATLAYKVEEVDGGLADVISVLDVKGVESGDTTKEGFAANSESEAAAIFEKKSGAKVFSLMWKRGANGNWGYADDFDTVEWDMLKASNGTLYITIDGKYDAEGGIQTFRMSKEAKVKIPKSAKAPTVKVDYVKGTLALKNGMQIRLVDGEEGNPWMDVIAYDKTAQDNGIFALAEDGLKTNKKASKVVVADFAEAINVYLTEAEEEGEEETDDFVAGTELTLELRTAATEKKFPSMCGIMKLTLPAAAPTVADAANGETGEEEGAEANIADLVYAKADKASNTTAAYTVKFSDLFTKADDKQYTDYEYVVVADPADGVNLEKQKWTKLTGESVDWAKNIGKKFTYYKAGSTEKATVQYESIKAIYIRLAAVKGDKETTGVFASEYATIYVNPVAEYTITNDAESAVKVDFKVGDVVKATKAKEGATVSFTYTASTGKVLDAMTCTAAGSAVKLTEGENNAYSFTMPAGHVVLKITEKDAPAQEPETPDAGE